MDHPGALGHAADREPAGPCDRDLRPRVRRQDRAGRGIASVGRERGGGGPGACEHLVERQRDADHAGREHEHLLGREPELCGETLGRGDGVGLTLRARGGVRAARR